MSHPTPIVASVDSGSLPGVGQTIGHYELIRELGRGGMGVVYLARDTKLARCVAIKFLLTEHAALGKRFLTEARTTARCHHENIVIIHDIDAYRGTPFMVLEYLRGQNLREFAAGVPMQPRRAIELMLPVVRALACAHEHGIVHRDLKPENVFVTRTGVVKVLDFGIAKLLSEHTGDRSSGMIPLPEHAHRWRMTHTGAVLGTPRYMSPEQMRGESLDHRTDVWAVGMMLYELVLGEHPWAQLNCDSLADLARGDSAVPSARERLPEIGELAAIIDRCLATAPAGRIASAAALLAELEACLPTRHSLRLLGDQSPFAGRAAFQERDAERFFGRSREIVSILTRLRSQPLVTVVGASGTGKSSLLRAGVIPALKQSGEGWHAMILRPGRRPLTALSDALCRLLDSASSDVVSRTDLERTERATYPEPATRDALARRLLDEPGMLGAELRLWASRKLRRVVLFVDQFEELYTQCNDRKQRAAFVRCLQGAADDAASPLRVILTIRSDFLERAIHQPGITAEGMMFLAPMTRTGMREALTGPVEAVGYRFESPGLVEDILDALDQTPGVLPLLQFTATRLWDYRDRDRRELTRASYHALGEIAGILAKHADTVLAAMPTHRFRLTRAIFERLVTPQRHRRVATLGELRELVGDPDELECVVHDLADARLLGIEDTSDRACAKVELIHDSLITNWPTLRRWLDENQGDAEFLAQLRNTALAWDRAGCAPGMLWRDETADDARRWYARYTGTLPARERRYLDAVFALARRARRWRMLAFGMLIAVLLMLTAATTAFIAMQHQRAHTESQPALQYDD